VPQPDLVLPPSYETSQATMIGAQKLMLALLIGKVEVRGLRNMGTFGSSFLPRSRTRSLGVQPIALAPQ